MPKIFASEEMQFLYSLQTFLNTSANRRFLGGIGDDAAIRLCKKDEQLIFTADTLVENVHFSYSFMTPEEVGFKAMVANLSDCAAMGAIPDSALVQIVFPFTQDTKKNIQIQIKKIYTGFHRACRKWSFPIVGGDLSIGPCWVLAISLQGRRDRNERLLKRIGARPGDQLWVTGQPGRSLGGLKVLQKWGREKVPESYQRLVKNHICPQPRIETGLQLSNDPQVHAVIDLSDGISKECYTLCFENGVGILLHPDPNSISPLLRKLSEDLNESWESSFLYGGEDYELLFASSPSFDPTQYHTVNLNKIGTITDQPNTVQYIRTDGKIVPVSRKSWDHFTVHT